jgi:hypothetical protein
VPRIANNSPPPETSATFAASGDLAHRSAREGNPTHVDSRRRRMDTPTMPQRDGTGRKCAACNLLLVVLPCPKKSKMRYSPTQKMQSS